MLRGIVVVAAVLVGAMLLVHTVSANGSILRYMDAHPDPRWVPEVEYYLGESYYFFQDIPTASLYFSRVPVHYPNSPMADDAYFAYLQCEDDTLGLSRATLIAENQKYLDRFPKGQHAAVIQDRIAVLSSR